MGLFRKKPERKTYDPKNQKPVFQDIHTGSFEEVMLIQSDVDVETFRSRYGIAGDIVKIY